jgi:hypothetical protein
MTNANKMTALNTIKHGQIILNVLAVGVSSAVIYERVKTHKSIDSIG